MSNILKQATNTKTIALVAIFTALYAVLRIIPTVPMIGASNASFSLSDVIAPIYGIILGPYIGGLSTTIGTFLAMAMGKPVSFMFLDFLPATIGAVSLGLLIKKKWVHVIAINVTLLAVFLIHPNTSVLIDFSLGETTIALPFAWLHIVALAVLISPLGRKAAHWVTTNNTTKTATGIALLVFIGTMMQHLMGNLLFETIMAQPLGSISFETYHMFIWPSIFLVYPVERLGLIALATIVGTPLLRVLKKTFLLPEE
ncbi:MAG: ECF transporter S component [Candidatus Bathyarchaeota archaeon]|nr:ECF transporter S component [Candidatus Bathyarchaeum sp.]